MENEWNVNLKTDLNKLVKDSFEHRQNLIGDTVELENLFERLIREGHRDSAEAVQELTSHLRILVDYLENITLTVCEMTSDDED